MRRLPQRPREHILQKKSQQFLITVLPEEWIVRIISEDDYGLDAVVEIVVGTDVTGARFLIQLKSTDTIKTSRLHYISHSCKTTTLNYFLEQSEHVMYIVYDEPNKTGYWIWVQDYIREHLMSKLQGQTKHTIRIPITNTFDPSVVNEILQRVLPSHRDTTMLQAVDSLNRTNPYFRYTFGRTSDGLHIGLAPRYPGAERDHPIQVKGTLQFDQNPEAQAALAALQNAFTTGAPVDIDPQFVQEFTLPSVMTDLLPSYGNYRLHSFSLGPGISDERLQCKLTILDAEQQPLHEVSYLDLLAVQAGSEETTYSNEHQQFWLNFRLRINYKDGKASAEASMDFVGRNVKQVQRGLQFSESVKSAQWMTLTDIESEEVFLFPFTNKTTQDTPAHGLQLVERLVFIQKRTGSLIAWPGAYTAEEAMRAAMVAMIIERGEILIRQQPVFVFVTMESARAIVDELLPKDKFSVAFEQDNLVSELFGTTIQLGEMVISIPDGTLLPETRETLTTLDTYQESAVSIGIDPGEHGSVYSFPRWLPERDAQGNDEE